MCQLCKLDTRAWIPSIPLPAPSQLLAKSPYNSTPCIPTSTIPRHVRAHIDMDVLRHGCGLTIRQRQTVLPQHLPDIANILHRYTRYLDLAPRTRKRSQIILLRILLALRSRRVRRPILGPAKVDRSTCVHEFAKEGALYGGCVPGWVCDGRVGRVQEDVASVWGNRARQLCLQGIRSVWGG